jgi:hypothetical protein
MVKIEKIPIEEAKRMKESIQRKANILEEYKGYINGLAKNEAGKIKFKNYKEALAIRNRLKRASYALGINVKIKKFGNEVVFYQE